MQAKSIIFYSRHFIGQPHQYPEDNEELALAVKLLKEFWTRLANDFQWQTIKRSLKDYERFLMACDALGPKEALLSAVESRTPVTEPNIALRALVDRDLDRLTTVLDEFAERRVEISHR